MASNDAKRKEKLGMNSMTKCVHINQTKSLKQVISHRTGCGKMLFYENFHFIKLQRKTWLAKKMQTLKVKRKPFEREKIVSIG